jgi:succinate dehydrogenase/fumarate reductase flavoprotein subunit
VETVHCDVAIIGSGGAALAAAVTAAHSKLKVILVERADVVGGTSAISGGALWIPCTRQSVAGGFKDSPEEARIYLRAVLADSYREDIIDTFLRRGPEALAFLEDHTELKYTVRDLSPDYYPELPGATDCGRALEVGEFDGRKLGGYFERLRPPPACMMGFGGMMVNRLDIYHFTNMRRSLKSVLHLARLTGKFAWDRLRYSRGTRLVIGNSMVAALLKNAIDNGVDVRLGMTTTSFISNAEGRVLGVMAKSASGTEIEIRSRGGVVLGTGGMSRHPNVLRDRPGTRSDHISMASPNADGTMIALAERELGAQVGGKLQENFYWAPMSETKDKNGARVVFPHIVTDRAKPGIIAVTEKGERFVNEANSYHRFVQAMTAQQQKGIERFYLIADRTALYAYGLGLVRPKPGRHRPFVKTGYLIEAPTVDLLAARLEIDGRNLQKTIDDFNQGTLAGVDPRFQRGASSYNRAMGDRNAKHPNLAPLKAAPYYAVRIFTGDLGSAKGLFTDANARVLSKTGSVIPGLYAVGTDMNSVVGGTYPGPGIVLGTGLTFGYIAATAIIEELNVGAGF